MTTKAQIYKLNLETVKKEELSFIQSYKIDVTDKGTFCGVGMWFDISFGKSFTPMTLSSSPMNNLENYFHAIFYLKNPIFLEKGDQIIGNVGAKVDESDKTKIHLKISYNIKNRGYNEKQIYYAY